MEKVSEAPDPLTVGNAGKRLKLALMPFIAAVVDVPETQTIGIGTDSNVSDKLKWVGEPIDVAKLLEGFHAPSSFQGPKGDVPYSFPRKVNILLLNPPILSRMFDTYPGDMDVMTYKFSIGMARSRFPEDSGIPTRDPEGGKIRGLWRWSAKSTSDVKYTGSEATCWANCDLYIPGNGKPFMELKDLQNSRLSLDSSTYREIENIRDGLTGRDRKSWKSHYNRILRDTIESVPAFAYQHRAMLLPLVVISAMKNLGVEDFVLRHDEHSRSIYQQTFGFLSQCETKVNLHDPEFIDKLKKT